MSDATSAADLALYWSKLSNDEEQVAASRRVTRGDDGLHSRSGGSLGRLLDDDGGDSQHGRSSSHNDGQGTG